MNPENLLCKDCAHSRASLYTRITNSRFGFRCSLDWIEPTRDNVTGEVTKGFYHSCGATRMDDKICGRSARAWTPRKKHGLLTLLKVLR